MTQGSENQDLKKSKKKERSFEDDAADWGFGRPLLKNPWFYFALIFIGVITAVRPLLRSTPPPLPVLAVLNDFEFVKENGEAFGSESLKGEPYVASFIFTRCPSVCPMVSQKMADLQNQLKDGGLPVRLVSFTVDPNYDRPSVLKSYSNSYKADLGRWSFLSPVQGEEESYLVFLENTFGVAIGRAEGSEPLAPMDIAHSEKFLLVDAKGRLRGYFESNADGINEIFHRSVALLGESSK